MIKNIYILWFQGFDNAPEIVKKCVQSWRFYNPDWNIITLDDSNLHQYIDLTIYDAKPNMSQNHRANMVRMLLLNKYGGLWTDATTFCNRPLNDWLPHYAKEGIFMFNNPRPGVLVSNWFIYSEPNNYIMKQWLDKSERFFINKDGCDEYFWMHSLFLKMYTKNIIFRQSWDRVPKISANGPHIIQRLGFSSFATTEIKKMIKSQVTPLYKLSWKIMVQPKKRVHFASTTHNVTQQHKITQLNRPSFIPLFFTGKFYQRPTNQISNMSPTNKQKEPLINYEKSILFFLFSTISYDCASILGEKRHVSFSMVNNNDNVENMKTETETETETFT